MRVNRCILFKNGIETLGYFSLQIARTLREQNFEVFVFDLLNEETSYQMLLQFIRPGETAMICFNFTGLRNEDCFYPKGQECFWNQYQIPCLNIVVDHPFYYNELIRYVPKRYTQLCIDSYHEAYMKRFFPNIHQLPFLPLGGTQLGNECLNKTMDIVFTGNYTMPETFEKHIKRLDDDYTKFYYDIINDLITSPNQSMDEVFERHLKAEMDDLSDHDLAECMGSMIFIDLYVRFYFRGLVVKTLVDYGLKVHVFGAGWEQLNCKIRENLILGGPLNSEECLEKIKQAKISLNVMPWFKDGAHDRIFNSMLNHGVCVTDGSEYLDHHFVDDDDIIFYSLDHIEQLPEKVKRILNNEDKRCSIAERAYIKAKEYHSWEKRTEVLIDTYLEKLQ